MANNMSVTGNRLTYLLIILLIAGSTLRLYNLDHRPVHGDEAVNAAKLNQLMQSGHFHYDPADYHGPLLFYCSWPLAKLGGKSDWRQLTEQNLRLVTVLFGLLLLLLPFLLKPFLSDRLLLLIVFFLAFSPPLIFYNRYYIHESLFIFWLYLTLFLFLRAWLAHKASFYFWAGVGLAMAMATKETWPLFLFSLLLALGLLKISGRLNVQKVDWFSLKKILLFLTGLLLPLFFIFSDFGRNWNGLQQFLVSFKLYFQRGYQQPLHVHPWYQYLKWLFLFRLDSWHWATEFLSGLLMLLGLFYLIKKEKLTNGLFILLTIGLTGLLCALLFSLIPYKTPWNLLPFWYGLLFLAAYGLDWLWQRFPQTARLLLLLFLLHYGWQYYQQNFVKDCSPQNPYVYAHPTRQVVRLASTVDSLLNNLPSGRQTYLQVMVPQNDYWPLPWYFRHLEKVGWWSQVPDSTPPAPLILADVILQDSLTQYLYEKQPPGQRPLYLPYFPQPVQLRPGRPQLQLFIQKEVFDRMKAQ
ncbi:MAG: TIGR03663 family protein [Caldisericaceae bacterium]|nr:TIGR03663 family protein [Caldisericaceae bacterium]